MRHNHAATCDQPPAGGGNALCRVARVLPSGGSLDIASMGADRHNPGTRGGICIEDGDSDLHYRVCTLLGSVG